MNVTQEVNEMRNRIQCRTVFAIVTCIVFAFSTYGTIVSAAVTLPTEDAIEKRVTVELPVEDQDMSLFDFILDPQMLLYATDAAEFGGGVVEKDATMLFPNSNGKYDFSGKSDMLTVKNRGNSMVVISVTATVNNLSDVIMLDSDRYDGSDNCSMYVALVDERGQEVPISKDGTVKLVSVLDKVPDDAYVYKFNPETGGYDHVLTKNESEMDWPHYSFGLKGSCNPEGRWADRDTYPSITVKWSMETVDTGDNTEKVTDQQNDDTKSVSANNAENIEGVSNNNIQTPNNAPQSDPVVQNPVAQNPVTPSAVQQPNNTTVNNSGVSVVPNNAPVESEGTNGKTNNSAPDGTTTVSNNSTVSENRATEGE